MMRVISVSELIHARTLRSRLIFLQATAFFTGMSIMGLEMLASRFLAPYFGTSTYVWATIIGMAMIALSVGYVLGGRWADRNPRSSGLFKILFVAACLTLIIPIGRIISRLGFQGAVEMSWIGFAVGLFGSLGLFFVPMMLLACASPYIIRLAARTVGTVGTTSGRIYSVSTVGSIAGVFLTTFLGMPYLGVVETLLAYGILMLTISTIGLKSPLMGVMGGLLILGVVLAPTQVGGEVLFEGESVYNYVRVVESSNDRLLLKLNEGIGSQSVYSEDDLYTRGIWDYFLAPLLFKPNAKDVLVIGFAGGTAGRQYLELSNASIVGVEIDPLVVEVSKRYFGVKESDRLDVEVADGRTYLLMHQKKFDIIIMDAFNPPTIPFHLATKEFFELVEERLKKRGVVAVNVPRYGRPAHVVDPVCATLESVFDEVFLVDRRPNIPQLALAFEDDVRLEEFVSKVEINAINAPKRIVNGISSGVGVFDGDRSTILTDNRSPIEILVHKIIFDYATGEESLDLG